MDVTTQKDNSTPVAPDTTAAPPTGAAATPTPQPGTPAASVQAAMTPYLNNEQTAIQKAADIANKPIAAPTPGPHARLLAMVQGLALGADAFGKSIATHGREGGVQEVAQVQGEQQQQKIAQQQAAQAAKNAQIQQQITVADTNHKLAQNVLFMATLPNEIKKSDLGVQQQEQTVAAGKADLAKVQADFMSQFGMTPDQFNSMIGGADGAAPAGGVSPQARQNVLGYAQQKVAAASKILRADDPYLVQAQKVLSDPNATPQDVFGAVASVNRQLGLQAQVQEQKSKKEAAEANSPVSKLGSPEALAQPGAQAAIQAKIDDPATDPADVPRLRALLPQAAVAQYNAEQIKLREQRNQQVINQGDPAEAGKLLANRSLTLAELKSRQVTPAFIADAIKAAQGIDPTFKAAESEGQARIAAAPANQQFFGNTDSLLVKGGTLDQLDAAGKALGGGQIPAFNTLENLRQAALGKGPQAAYAAAILGVSDDYSKVMTGGQGSDTSREQALQIINKNLSPEGRAAAIEQIRKSVQSQRNGRIGTNPYLRDMYPDPYIARLKESRPSNASANAILMSVPGGEPHWIEPANVQAAKNVGAIEIQ
jgi:hypothetical protein